LACFSLSVSAFREVKRRRQKVQTNILSIPMHKSDKPRVRIRGIYATALTKIFLDKGFEIIQPSDVVAERFSLSTIRYLSPQVDIIDKPNRHGVIIESLAEITDKIYEIFFEVFPDVVVHKSKVQKGAIYKGIVYRPAPSGGYIVKLSPNLDGLLPLEETTQQQLKLGDTILVEVKNPKNVSGLPIVSMKITIPGDFAVLIPEEAVRVSHKIRGGARYKLLELGKVLRPDGWGIVWRTGAANANLDELQEEINILHEQAEKLRELAEKSPALVMLRSGFDVLMVDFPFESKKKLDEIRKQVFHTVKYHHMFKTYDNNITRLVDFSEKYLSKYVPMDKINDAIQEFFVNEALLSEGRIAKIHHLKIHGREVILGPAKIVMRKNKGNEISEIEYRLYRRFMPGGYYDGIGAPKEAGDYGITIVKLFDDKLITAYFSIENELKGIYININTPIEPCNDGFRYIDLEVDVVLSHEGHVMVLDSQKIDKYVEEGIISKSLAESVKKKAEKYKEWLESEGVDEILGICDEVRRKIEEEITEQEEEKEDLTLV